MSRSQLELQCATFPARDVNTGSALFNTLSWWPSGSKPTLVLRNLPGSFRWRQTGLSAGLYGNSPCFLSIGAVSFQPRQLASFARCAQSRDAGQRCQSPSFACKEGGFSKSSEPRKWPLISRVATPMPGPGRDKTKSTFQLHRRHLRQSQKVKVKAARCRAEDGIVQTCLSTLDHA